ncbi:MULTISPECIES: fumarylacetoacetate hydrolase family protein [unclassified Variovorax]|uniref:fumarylacetoacetate hydrolase family protein n=1 Tax=unclassified Variovorax TaxID=663243 RepID=UPI0025775FCC|nr:MULTISPECIES: fumarylacetoacetate hydrolase family protein [unclassified Variovorax]MDM0087852.1 fumarylacetoacetate hydrolase family protein [Variovorax sp. J22G40]MDM0143891.1 fumarylacetoacetate hydrolase family protein [Variovorax sp. J2P1-31]
MKFASYELDGRASWGAVVGDIVVPLATPALPTLKDAIAAEALPQSEAGLALQTGVPLSAVRWLPVIPEPGKIFCIGVNYEEHRVEMKRERVGHPTVFMRVADSQIGHGQPMLRPPESEQLDYEGEIAIVIGRGGRRIAEADAWTHIAGYAPYNDGSVRAWQRHTTQWTPGKNFSGTGGFGPWMVTRGEIADGEVLTLETRLNGKVMQHATTDMLLFDIPSQIAYISSFTTLRPGDVIVTGTPGGVGARHEPPIWMKPGDRIEVEVSKLGTLVNLVAQE